MGLFNGYLKPGPGIRKDAPPKPPVVAFFETVGRKYSELFRLNLMNIILSIPLIFILFTIYVNNFMNPEASAESRVITYSFYMVFAIVIFVIVGFAPVQTGTSYLLTQYSIENPTFFLYDFFQSIKKNIKQALVIMVADLVFGYLMLVNYNFYTADLMPVPALKYPVVVCGVIYVMMHMYMYPLMFTYEIKTVDIFKKSFLLAILNLPQNLGILLLVAIIPFAALMYPSIISYIILFLAAVPFMQLMVNFYVNRVIKKYIRPEESDEEKEEEEAVAVMSDEIPENNL